MSEFQDQSAPEVETVVGEVIELDESVPEQPESVEDLDLDEDAVLAEEDDLDLDDTSEDVDRTDGAVEGEVMVLDTWQIEIPATGDDRVDAALSRLTEVEGLPPGQHAEVYESVHAGLQDALADLDQA